MSDFRLDQSPVRNQGDRPTCVAFAISAAHEWAANENAFRSPEDAMWAAHQIGSVPGREEVSVTWALAGLQAHGHATELAWPYGQPRWNDRRPHAACQLANRRALPSFRLLSDTGFETVASELSKAHPVIMTMKVVRLAWREPGGLVDADAGAKTPGNHAVLAVGALTAPDRIIVKNSWGPRWGDHGYGYVTRRYIEHYALRAHALERS